MQKRSELGAPCHSDLAAAALGIDHRGLLSRIPARHRLHRAVMTLPGAIHVV